MIWNDNKEEGGHLLYLQAQWFLPGLCEEKQSLWEDCRENSVFREELVFVLGQEEIDIQRIVEDIEDFAANRLSVSEGTVKKPPSKIRMG